VLAKGEDFTGRALKVGYGFGFRFNTPVGLLRVDLGIPHSTLPNRSDDPVKVKKYRFYFGIGHIF